MSRKIYKTVEEWYRHQPVIPEVFESNALTYVFNDALQVQIPHLFEHLYIPMRYIDPSTHHMTDQYVVVDFGLEPYQIANIYWTLYRRNVLAVDFVETAMNGQIYWPGAANELSTRVKNIVRQNLPKYKRLIEVEGFQYNPTFNVDGIEITTIMDSHGNIIRQDTPILQTQQNLQTASYDGNLKNTSSTSMTYAGKTDNGDHKYSENKESHEVVKTKNDNNQDVDYVANAKDTAFGQKMVGADYFHNEKHIRQGNIGVTKTTELLEDQRNFVKFNIIQEFFNDINPHILAGIYPGF